MFRYKARQELRGVDKHLKSIGGKMGKTEIPEEWKGFKTASDLIPPRIGYGDYIKVREIVGTPVKIVYIGEWSGKGDPSMKGGPSLLINADLVGGGKCWFVVSHQVLYNKLKALQIDVPFLATFYKVDKKRYFDIE